MAAPTTTSSTVTPTPPAAPRQIVGFNKPSIVSAPKARSRAKKSKATTTTNGNETPEVEESSTVKVEEPVTISNPAVEEEEELVIEEKKSSAVDAVHKRIRAATKKVVSTSLRQISAVFSAWTLRRRS